MDVNKIRVSIQNYGSSGNDLSGPSVFFYEWPTNSGRGYVAYQALYVGAMVTTDGGEERPLVTITHRSDQEGNSMMWEPVPGYLNPNSTKIAISDDESTWPPTGRINPQMRTIQAGLDRGTDTLVKISLMQGRKCFTRYRTIGTISSDIHTPLIRQM